MIGLDTQLQLLQEPMAMTSIPLRKQLENTVQKVCTLCQRHFCEDDSNSPVWLLVEVELNGLRHRAGPVWDVGER